jgi:hypothetical protein
MAAGNVGLSLPIPTHTESGVAELVKIEVWRRNSDGRLIQEIERYAIGICRFDEAAPLEDADFSRALVEAQQALPVTESQLDGVR